MSYRHRRIVRTVLALALVVAACSPALAEAREIHDRFNIRLAYVATDTKTDLAAGRVLGAVVRIEDVLGYDSNDQTFGLAGFYRFRNNKKGRHAINFTLYDSRRDSQGVVAGSVPIFDLEFIGAFKSEYDTTTFSLGYRYSLLRTERGEAGIGIGLSTIKYDFKLAGLVVDPENPMEPEFDAAESADFLAPLPTIGFFLKFAVMENLIFDVFAQALDIEVSDIEGRVLTTGTRLTWYFVRNVGVGIGIGGTDVDATKTGGSGELFKVNYRQNTANFNFSFVF